MGHQIAGRCRPVPFSGCCPGPLADLAAAVGGTLHDADPARPVTGSATFDSRLVEPGGVFVALAGEHADGHDFAGQAHAAGAIAVLASRPVEVPAIMVDDVPAAYARLSSALVDRLPQLAVVGVTGSVGKTTTKDLIGQVLSRLGPTIAPPGNRNSETGVPETVSWLADDSRFLVLEMGARHVGDIAYLAAMVRLDVGVALNVGSAHLGTFGSRQAIARAKGEIVEALTGDGVAVLNADDPLVAAMATRTPAKVVTFGRAPDATVRAEQVLLDAAGRASFRLCTPHGRTPVRLGVHGEHLVHNALAAAAVGLQFTDDLELIADALSSAGILSPGRMHVTHRPDGVTIVDDAYNANPTSMTAALAAVTALAGGRRVTAVLGQMNELGTQSAAEHVRLGEAVALAGVTLLVAVGNDDAGQFAAAAAAGGVEVVHVADREAAAFALAGRLSAGDVVLVKGSNGVGLMTLARELANADS